jgi:cytochrome d ubiquinol oxidase subunit II
VSTTIAIVLLVALMAYAVFGGAEFGAGFWDLIAGGPEQGAEPRTLTERSIGPVWEATHVWLIFVFVVTWRALPAAHASIVLTMFVPLTLAALGIVLRGASFAFELFVLNAEASHVFDGLLSRALPTAILSVVCGFGASVTGQSSPAGDSPGRPRLRWWRKARDIAASRL